MSEKYDLISKFYFEINLRLLDVTMLEFKPFKNLVLENTKRGIIKTFFGFPLKLDKLDKLRLFNYICSPSVCSFVIASSEISFFVLSLISILIVKQFEKLTMW